MKKTVVLCSIVLFAFAGYAVAWTPVPVENDPLVRMPGSQPIQDDFLFAPSVCKHCHGEYSQTTEPYFTWQGSMMTQSARDPLFYAAMTVAGQDSLWAVGTPNAIDICERCHFPEGWLEGRSDPANASAMQDSDFDGVHCDFCHRMWDPFYETTYNGIREGSDWSGYWDESGNTGPGSGTTAQTEADNTYLEDMTLSSGILFFTGIPFYSSNLPLFATYDENTGGQYFVSEEFQGRAGFADAARMHDILYSRYHKSRFFCGTCHDVSNPVLANLGSSGLPDQSSGSALITEQYPAGEYFHVERTFSEFMLSAYGRLAGSATNPEFQSQGAADIPWASKCQDCHMRDVNGTATNANAPSGLLRPDESTEHPNSGLPLHDLTGGNLWMSYILATLDPSLPEYDPVNASILSGGPAALTLDLSAGETPLQHGNALLEGSQRAKQQLSLAASILNLSYDPSTGSLSFKILNNTGHKLISGFPEGRRMFANIQLYSGGSLLYEINPYDYTVGTLKGLPDAPSSPPLSAQESYVDELVYEMHPSSTLTGEAKTFHFVLATGRYKDNRIPPKGFDISSAQPRLCEPVVNGVSRPDYFSPAEYTGGYDDIAITTAPGADYVSVVLYYQGTSREYIEFLRDEINGTSATLSSPAPSGEPQAYIIQSDPFFAGLSSWGNVIWDLWYHNHGLDGTGTPVEGIAPCEMTRAVWSAQTVVTLVGFEAQPGNAAVTLTWSTASEVSNLGFNLYRSEKMLEGYRKITGTVIPSRGNAVTGAHYRFSDTTVNNRRTYYYILEDIDRNGTTTQHGPVRAVPRMILGKQ